MRNKMCWIFPCFAVVLLFGGCQRDDSVAQPLALYDCLGEAEAEVVEAFQLDGESWTREENSDSIEYFTETGAELCGYPAWMQVVFEEGTHSRISCYFNIEGATEEEKAEEILDINDSCL